LASDNTPTEYQFDFITTDLTFAQVALFADYLDFLTKGEPQRAGRTLYALALSRLVNPDDAKRLSAVPWKSFPSIFQQIRDGIEKADQINRRERQLHSENENGEKNKDETNGGEEE
jgi:hypothetical protein